MKYLLAILVCAGVAFSGQARASAELAKSKNCMGCHALDKKVLGPSFRDVAGKYQGQKDAQAKVIASITKGSINAWGPMAMPPNPVSAAEALSLATYVLAQK